MGHWNSIYFKEHSKTDGIHHQIVKTILMLDGMIFA